MPEGFSDWTTSSSAALTKEGDDVIPSDTWAALLRFLTQRGTHEITGLFAFSLGLATYCRKLYGRLILCPGG